MTLLINVHISRTVRGNLTATNEDEGDNLSYSTSTRKEGEALLLSLSQDAEIGSRYQFTDIFDPGASLIFRNPDARMKRKRGSVIILHKYQVRVPL